VISNNSLHSTPQKQLIFKMMKYVIVVLALIAVASAQLLTYGAYGYNSANLHPGFASSTSTGIRRFGSTAGYLAPAYGYAAPGYLL
jgi:hypothetical protein